MPNAGTYGWFTIEHTTLGNSTLESAIPLRGLVRAIYIVPETGIKNTATLVVKTAGEYAVPSYNLLSLAAPLSSKMYMPVLDANNVDGSAYSAGNVPAKIPVDDKISVVLALANATDYVDVHLYLTEH